MKKISTATSKNPKPKTKRDARHKLKAKPNDDLCREELTILILAGQYNPKTLYELCQKYDSGLNWVRQRANEAFSLVRILQNSDKSTEEQKQILKADIDQKLDYVYNRSLVGSKPDLRTALAVLNSKAKLNNIYAPESIELINNPMMKITQVEIQHIKETGQLPQSILDDWNNTPQLESHDEKNPIR